MSELGVAMFSRIYLGESSAMTPVWDGRELLSSAAIKKSTFLSTASPLYPPHGLPERRTSFQILTVRRDMDRRVRGSPRNTGRTLNV